MISRLAPPCRCREACLEQIERGNACETDGSGSGPGATAINYRQLASDLELLQVRGGRGGRSLGTRVEGGKQVGGGTGQGLPGCSITGQAGHWYELRR